MRSLTRSTDPDYWLEQMFAAKAARTGGVVRRSRLWVDREVGRDRFIRAVRLRGFHLIRTADQFIVVCHDGPVEMMF
ncbi:N-(5'-phosphoribosyl)anthranilate isomerase [Pelagivirga sediminicola]|uniref:N-(5'-phosphoribosyl)anthranilate isomerase n=1 Tax=Pelagivirga sediminicola TaxID=2170575 RepID=A0A2T7G4S1_9RHOB|nr:N-(5'-phosphoribosyl)anthranilate isomerase [Pelagivirga sediminicola]PVA09414.1 N-(5'-phosphoribosyl)anthranilate isomerase [Pelagivirga sediminicola]